MPDRFDQRLIVASFLGVLGSIAPWGCALKADNPHALGHARQQAGCGAVGFSHFGCPDDYVCMTDGQCVRFDESQHIAFRFSEQSDVDAEETPKSDGSVAAYIDIATAHLRTSLAQQGPLLESLGMQVQKLDEQALKELARTYANYDAKLQELDNIAVQIADQLKGIDPAYGLEVCQELFEVHDFVQPVADSDTQQRMAQCLHTYDSTLVAIEIANSKLSSFDSLVFARMRTTLGHMQEALRSGLGSNATARAVRVRELPTSLLAIAGEIFQGLGAAQLLFPVVRMEVSVDIGTAVLAHRVGYFAQLAAFNLSNRLPSGADALVIFHQALSAAVGEMKRNEQALSEKLSHPWPTKDAWQLVPVMENAGLLSLHPELSVVHANLSEQLAEKENWQPLANGLAAGICFVGGIAALFSVIGAPAAFLLCAPATVFGVVTWLQLRQVSSNALMLAFFGPEQGLMSAAEASHAARQTRWAGSFVALDFLGILADSAAAVRAIDSLRDALHMRRMGGDAFFAHVRTLPPLRASGMYDTSLARHVATDESVRAVFEQPAFVSWAPGPGDAIEYGFELEVPHQGIERLYRAPDFTDEAWDALSSEQRLDAIRRTHRAGDRLYRLSSAPDFFPQYARPDVGSFELNGFTPVSTLGELRHLQWETSTPLIASTEAINGYLHTHVSFPWTLDPTDQRILARYWVLWNEMAMFDLFKNPKGIGNYYMGPVSRNALNDLLAAMAHGPDGRAGYSKWHFLGFRNSTLYGRKRIGFEIRVGGFVSESTGPDNQVVHTLMTSLFLQNPTRHNVQLQPRGIPHSLVALDEALWDMPGAGAFQRMPEGMQAYIDAAISESVADHSRRLEKLQTNLSVPMVDWQTRPFLAHKQAEILTARQAFLEEMQNIMRTIDVAISPADARGAIYQAVAHWAESLRFASLY